MADVYEFEIGGTIGPLVARGLPELSTVAETGRTVLTGSAAGPDDLRRLLDLLDAHGTAVTAVRISVRRAESGAGSGAGHRPPRERRPPADPG